jgi:mannosyltransferase
VPARLAAALLGSRSAQAVLALTLLGGALRFGTLDVQSIWLDESATLILVHRGLGGMLSHLASSESTPPLYYILVWAWSKVFGSGPIGLRSFSALAGTLTIPVMYAAGRQISNRVGLWAAVLASVSPPMYYYSQEARCYALLTLFSAAALVAFQRSLGAPRARSLALWAALSALALLTHYFAVFLFVPQALILARRLGWRTLRAPAGAVVLVGIALLPLAIKERSDGKASWIEAASLSKRTAETAKQFLVGLYGPREVLTAALAGVLAAGAVALVAFRGEERERSTAADMAIVAAVAVGVPLALAVAHVIDIFDGRNTIAVWAPLALLVAAGLGAARAPRAGALLGAGLGAVSLAVIISTNLLPGYQRDDWRGVARSLPATVSAEGRVIVGPQLSSAPLSIYMGALQKTTAAGVLTDEVAFVALRTRRTGHAPAEAVVPSGTPAGFRLASVRHSESFAVSTFRAARPQRLSAAELRRLDGDSEAEVIVQR